MTTPSPRSVHPSIRRLRRRRTSRSLAAVAGVGLVLLSTAAHAAPAATTPPFAQGLYLADIAAPAQPMISGTGAVSAVGLTAPTNGVVVSPDGATLYYASNTARTVSIVDAATGAVQATVPLGAHTPFGGPSALALSVDGARLYIAGADGYVTRIDTASRTVRAAVKAVPGNASLYGIAISSDGRHLIATDHTENRLLVLDPDTLALREARTVSNNPMSIKISPDDRVVYVSYDVPNTATSNLLTAHAIADGAQLNAASRTHLDLPSGHGLSDIALSADGSRLVAVTYGSDVVVGVDTETFAATGRISLPPGTAGFGASIQLSPDGMTAFVASQRAVQAVALDPWSLGDRLSAGSYLWSAKVVPDQAAVARFSAPDDARAGAPVTFDASASQGSTSPVARYDWDFGDGTTESSVEPVIGHRYAGAGTYTVRLTTTTAAGTSTGVVFSGQSVTRNGGPQAVVSHTVVVGADATVSPTPTPTRPTVSPTTTGPEPSSTTTVPATAGPVSRSAPASTGLASTGTVMSPWLPVTAVVAALAGVVLVARRRVRR